MADGKFHVNKETGRAGQCRATKKGCPLGDDTPHFDTKEQAKEFIEKDAAANNNQFGTVSKKKDASQTKTSGNGNSGGSNNKTLVGTPDPENNNFNENIINKMQQLKSDFDAASAHSVSNDEEIIGHSNESYNIAQLYKNSFENGINQSNLEDFKHELAERSLYLDRISSNLSEGEEDDYGATQQYYQGALNAVETALDRVEEIEKTNEAQVPKSNSVSGNSKGNAPKYHPKRPLSPMENHIKNGTPMPGEQTHYATKEEAIAAANNAQMNSRNTSASNFTNDQVENYGNKVNDLLSEQVRNAAIEVDVDNDNLGSPNTSAGAAASAAREANYEHQLRVKFLYDRAFDNGMDVNKDNIEKFKQSLVDAEKQIDSEAAGIENEDTRRIYTAVQRDAFKETFRQLNDIDAGGVGVHPLSHEYPKSVSTRNEMSQYAKLGASERNTYDQMYKDDRSKGGNKPHEELVWDSIYKNVSKADRETLVTANGSFKANYLKSRSSGVSHGEAIRGVSEFQKRQKDMTIEQIGNYTRLLARNNNNYDKTNTEFFGSK